ncbi:hypothetical protein LINPERPRIM_LOCUS25620 [Linum perenne]
MKGLKAPLSLTAAVVVEVGSSLGFGSPGAPRRRLCIGFLSEVAAANAHPSFSIVGILSSGSPFALLLIHDLSEIEAVMIRLREEEEASIEEYASNQSHRTPEQAADEPMYDPDYEFWEEWMGWEGARIRDYASHINPYI